MWYNILYLLVVATQIRPNTAGAGVAPTLKLNDGNSIPSIALGTYGTDEDIAKMRQAVFWAIEAGYRHIDTAKFYKNEEQIGQGIADAIEKGLVKREDLFVTTKLWCDSHGRDQVVPALKDSLKSLNLDYVDLYLIHFPTALKADYSPLDIDYLETWQGMEEGKKLGLAKSIGVSNFNTEQLDRIIANGTIVPAVNEIEVHPALTQERLISNCKSRDITVMAYSPFGFMVSRNNTNAPPPRVDDPALVEIAKKYGKTTTQVVLRYLIDRHTIPIPKSTAQKRISENIDIFDFQLTEDEITTISKFNSNTRVFDTTPWNHYPYYPFNKD